MLQDENLKKLIKSLKVSQWTQIRFITNAIGYKRVTLAIITDDETSSDHYWAIQEIQQCEENGNCMIFAKTLF